MDCYVGICTVGPVMFDFNEASGWILLVCILGIIVTSGLLGWTMITGSLPNLRESGIVQRLADRFESEPD